MLRTAFHFANVGENACTAHTVKRSKNNTTPLTTKSAKKQNTTLSIRPTKASTCGGWGHFALLIIIIIIIITTNIFTTERCAQKKAYMSLFIVDADIGTVFLQRKSFFPIILIITTTIVLIYK